MKALTTLAWLVHLTYLIKMRLINELKSTIPRLYVREYSKGECVCVWGREQHFLAKPLATCNPNWQLVRTVSVCQSFWLLPLPLPLLLVACARGKPQHAEQSRAEQHNARTHTLNTRSSWCRNRAPYNPQQSLQRGLPQLIFTLSACSFGHINQIQHFSYACAQTNKQHCVHIHSPMHVLFMQ